MACARAGFAVPQKTLNLSSAKICLTDVPGISADANPWHGHSSPWIMFQRRKLNLPGTHERIDAPALGFGRFRTPPTRYLPARHLLLLAEANRPESLRGAGDGGKPGSQNHWRDAIPAGSSTERRT